MRGCGAYNGVVGAALRGMRGGRGAESCRAGLRGGKWGCGRGSDARFRVTWLGFALVCCGRVRSLVYG